MKTFLCLCLTLILSQAAFSANYTVTKIADTNDGACDADCSLREAIVAANGTTDNDVINFSSTVFNTAQTITLSGTDIIITNNGTLAINGTGANLLTISGNNASRVFTNNVGAVTNINNLRVTGGNGASTINTGRAGGVYNVGGILTLNNVVVTGNTAANGGGLNNAASGATPANLTLINCTVSNNTSSSTGGGMQNFSTSTITLLNTTVSGNISNNAGLAGGAMQANGMVFISNSTFSGNNAPAGSAGAIYYNGTGLTMNNVTIANNTSMAGAGGLHKSTATLNANVRNTIIAGNTGGSGTPDVVGAISSQGNNLIGTVGTSTGWVASDILNQPANLAPLGNYGGPTQTHILLINSPAINAGQNCVVTATCAAGNPPTPLTTDQRGTGFPRQAGSAVDIGAVEGVLVVDPLSSKDFDFDGDGRTDYGVFRPSNATWFIQRSTTGFLATQFGAAADRLTPADFDGDGKADIAVWRSGGAFSTFYILQSSTNTVRLVNFGQPGDDPRAVNDWDGDGKADPAVFRNGASAGQPSFFHYLPSAQPGVPIVSIQWGINGDEAVRGDFDGDGKADAAVYRASQNSWFIRRSSDSALVVAQWGVSTDKRVPEDYDNDGKTDLAVYRDGLWAILQSSNNQPRFQQWGIATDKLVPGDYDGDGNTDLAVWRDGTFYVLRSNGNQLATFQFGASTDTPVASAYIVP